MALFARCIPSFSSSFEQDTALLAPVWRRWRETSRHGCEAPFFHVGFYENESHLSKIDMDGAWSIGADRWKEILCFKSMGDVFKFLAVTCEKDRSTSRSVSNTDNVTLYVLRTVASWRKRLIETTVTGRNVGNGRFVVPWESSI